MMDNIQLSLDLTLPPATPPGLRKRRPFGSANLYFALSPPSATAEAAVDLAHGLRRKHRLSAQPQAPHLLHVSVCNVGAFEQLPEAIVSAAAKAAASVQMARFALRFDRVLSFRHRQHPLVLCAREGKAEIRSLQAQLALALRSAGLRIGVRRDFEPHLTLFYDTQAIDETPLDAPIAWTVDDFVLIHSVVGKGRHERLGAWSLHDR